MTEKLQDLAGALLDAAKRAGAEAADALALRNVAEQIQVRGGRLEEAERSEGTDVGLRVLIGRRQACVASSDTRPEMLAEVAERAVAMARLAPEDPAIGLAEPEQLSARRDGEGLDLVDTTAPASDALLDAALRAEAGALALDGIRRVMAAGAGVERTELHLVASNGFSGGYARSSYGLSCVSLIGEGTAMERDGYGESRTHLADLTPPEEVGRLAAERTLARKDARKPPTGSFPVLFDERIASGLIGHLVSAADGAQVARGVSWLRDRLGERVLPAGIDLTEEPLRPRTGASRPFDAEGLACAPRKIVEDGVLMGWTLDLASARRLGLESTANARRSPSGPPSPGVTNLALTQGRATREDLIRDMGTGLLVTSLIGSSINPTTGDYSRGAAGFWVEGGEITHAVNECTIAGNLLTMLASLRPANDARTWTSRVVPSLLVEGLTVAGA